MHGSNFACLPRSSLLIMASMPTRAKIHPFQGVWKETIVVS